MSISRKLRIRNFYSIGPWTLYYKTLRIRNLRQMDRFRSKLVSFCFDNTHNLAQKQTHYLTTESEHFKSEILL
jgi:hypothetical protein